MAKKQKSKPHRTKRSESELADYFNEHVLYELLMLRFTHHRMQTKTQILWNAMLAAFIVSARNLYEFLNNQGTRNEVNRSEYEDHVTGFKLGSISKITGTLQKLGAQVFHLGWRRSNENEAKVSSKRADEVFEWIETNIVRFTDSFKDDFRARIDMKRADPFYHDGYLHVTPDEFVPDATNQIFTDRTGTSP